MRLRRTLQPPIPGRPVDSQKSAKTGWKCPGASGNVTVLFPFRARGGCWLRTPYLPDRRGNSPARMTFVFGPADSQGALPAKGIVVTLLYLQYGASRRLTPIPAPGNRRSDCHCRNTPAKLGDWQGRLPLRTHRIRRKLAAALRVPPPDPSPRCQLPPSVELPADTLPRNL